ncbi:MAG: LarC family nickel insertion protein, partial [Deltaproteobacteria bacterium]|nr:LarC family nickel insertion protein [Deltaproteobacteria bacterium]
LELKPIPLGTGSVKCAHGCLPVPVPAVMVLLEGLATFESGIKSELVTPTGAAILKTLVELLPPLQKNRVCKLGRSGYGAGQRQHPEKPNLLRLTTGTVEAVLTTATTSQYALETLVTLETIIDDMTPEKLAFLKDRLLADGALEVVTWPLFMKKGRLGNSLQVLLKPALEAKIVDCLFNESPTLGIRRFVGERYFLERKIRLFKTSFGEIRCKIASDKSGRIVNIKPEHDDLAHLAQSNDLPITRLEQLILAELDL